MLEGGAASAPSSSTARRSGLTDKQIELLQTSLRRPSSPSRTRGCSTNCASAPTISANRWSSRPRPRTCSRSSAARRSICKPCSTRWSNRRPGCATRTSAWLFRREGDQFYCGRGLQPCDRRALADRRIFQDESIHADRSSVTGRCALEGRVIHVADVLADPEYKWQRRTRDRWLPRGARRAAVARWKRRSGSSSCRKKVPSHSPTSRSSWSQPSPTRP